MKTLNHTYCGIIEEVTKNGQLMHRGPRETLEVYNHQYSYNIYDCILGIKQRRLNYAFMFAEAGWILTGSNRLQEITRFMKTYAQFSDDGLTMAGAYGPPFVDQLPYVVSAFEKDFTTRQATVSIWRPRPYQSKDIPCTLSATFFINHEYRLCSTFCMRSSDVYLGVPYDTFAFAMMTEYVRWHINVRLKAEGKLPLEQGTVTNFAVNRHIYTEDIKKLRSYHIDMETIPDIPSMHIPIYWKSPGYALFNVAYVFNDFGYEDAFETLSNMLNGDTDYDTAIDASHDDGGSAHTVAKGDVQPT